MMFLKRILDDFHGGLSSKRLCYEEFPVNPSVVNASSMCHPLTMLKDFFAQ
jgi:hypothetical protein